MKLFEEFKEYESMWDNLDVDQPLTEAPVPFEDSEFPSMLTPGKVYTLKDNYWMFPGTDELYDADNSIKDILLDPDNLKQVEAAYVKKIGDLKFCNTASGGKPEDTAFFFPKGKQFKFVKDVVLGKSERRQMFSDGKVVFLLGIGINKYLQ